MTTRNPYRIIERVAGMVGNAVLILICCVSVGVVLTLLISWLYEDAGWGWWSLLAIPGLPLALVALTVLGLLIRAVIDALNNQWRRAKFHWDDSRTERNESQDSGPGVNPVSKFIERRKTQEPQDTDGTPDYEVSE